MGKRLLFAAPSSGSGKTTVVCGLLQALLEKNVHPVAYKSGPDYIDPMFHSHVVGVPSENLDLFLMGQPSVTDLLGRTQGDVAILEGAMGYYDGIAMGHTASAYDLARTTQTPVVLVVDGKGSALSIAALVEGFVTFRPDANIQGVIINRVSPMVYPGLKKAIETHCNVTVYGCLPPCPEAVFESRHLGLITAQEVENLQEKVALLGTLCAQHMDIDGLLTLAETAPALPSHPRPKVANQPLTLAVAKDKAFCFYYQENLRLLEQVGFQIAYFSPLEGERLPPCHGLYLGGGYPELYAKTLSQNTTMMDSIGRAIAGGLPTIAECGGFLYLHKTLADGQGQVYPMVGVIAAAAFGTKKLSRFGYVTLTAQEDGLLGQAGMEIPAHEFHYWDSTDHGLAFGAQKPQSQRHWTTGHMGKTLYAGFPHFHFGGNPEALERFYQACKGYEKEGTQ